MRQYEVKNLLRGLGISELPKIFTTHFKIFFDNLMLHLKRHKVKQKRKKSEENKTIEKNGEKRRYKPENARKQAKTVYKTRANAKII